MLLLVILLVSELWALFVQIPSIRGYDEIVAPWVNRVRLIFGALILLIFIILSIVFFFGLQKGTFCLCLAKMIYRLSDYSQNNYVERLALIDELIDREGSNAEHFAERGRLYLEIAMIKTDRTEEYKYSLPDVTAEECYKRAIINFDDAIAQNDEVAEYYYLRGKAMDSLKFRADYAYSYRRLAELYKAENDTALVENTYSRAIKNCADNAEFYYARGVMYYDKDDFAYTIADMERAIEGDSSNKDNAYYMIGCSYYMLQDYNKAYEYYQLAKDNGYSNVEIDEYMNTCREYMEED